MEVHVRNGKKQPSRMHSSRRQHVGRGLYSNAEAARGQAAHGQACQCDDERRRRDGSARRGDDDECVRRSAARARQSYNAAASSCYSGRDGWGEEAGGVRQRDGAAGGHRLRWDET